VIGQYLIQLLQDEGFGTIGIDMFLNHQPDQPNNCITIYDETAGVLTSSHFFDNDNFGIQILARDIDSITANDKVMNIHRFITGYGGERMTPASPKIIDSQIVTTPASIGTDVKNRHEYSGHYSFMVHTENNTHRR
jgi:hypothetical protein